MSHDLPDNILRRLDEVADQYDAASEALLDPEILSDHRRVRTMSVRRSALEPVVEDFRRWREALARLDEAQQVLDADEDPEVTALAREELAEQRTAADTLAKAVLAHLVQTDDRSIGAVILEIRPGVGGDEAGLWAGDLLTMYERYAAERGWEVHRLQHVPGEAGGCRLAIIAVRGEGAWSHLGYEGGTHQVKRVPVTEAQGRVHTSTATVAVLAEPDEIEVALDPAEVKEMVTTSTGPGGQNVNKVATAIHLIHEPTGVEVRMQDTKSQAQNRQRAWQLLRARLYERQRAEADAQRAQQRKQMIGGGSRAEKIRTYRAKENLVVDHRLGCSFNLADVLEGGLAPLLEALVEEDTARRLADL